MRNIPPPPPTFQLTSHPLQPIQPIHPAPFKHHEPKHHEPKHHDPKHEQDGNPVYDVFHNNSTAPRENTDPLIAAALRKAHPDFHLTITTTYNSNLLGFAAAGHAYAISSSAPEEITAPADDGAATFSNEQRPVPTDLIWRRYIPPTRRSSGSDGTLIDIIKFGRFIYTWSNTNYILYNVVGGHNGYDQDLTYLLGTTAEANDALLQAAGKYWSEPHNEVLVFDGGYWRNDGELWESVQRSTWDDVILEASMKESIIGEVEKFFGGEERYKRLKVPWKRGIIFHGPPGNGKTISIKAIMHHLSHPRLSPSNPVPTPIPTLYIRTLSSPHGPSHALHQIFTRARSLSPCLLVFEDLDAILSPHNTLTPNTLSSNNTLSYFLNELDGLTSNNDGILVLGSTNHLDRLDEAVRKRPGRFDRKYFFGNPSPRERGEYCKFWRGKLLGGEGGEEGEGEGEGEGEYPERMCEAIAGITGGFSFAYLKEAFLASLGAIAGGDGDDDDDETAEVRDGNREDRGDVRDGDGDWEGEEGLERFVLWREMKKQVRILREELDD